MSNQSTTTSKHKSYKTRSNATCTTGASSDAQKGIVRAAARKAELQCRQEALKKRAELEKRALEVKQEMRMLEISTDLEVEDAKLATFEKLDSDGPSIKSSSAESDQMAHSEKVVKDWLNDDKNTTGFNNNKLILDDPVPVTLPPPMQQMEYSAMPQWKLNMDLLDDHQMSSPLQHPVKYEISSLPQQSNQRETSPPIAQRMKNIYQHASLTGLQWNPNTEKREMLSPLQHSEQHISPSPIQHSQRTDQHNTPMQWRSKMYETTNYTPVSQSLNPFAMPFEQSANNATNPLMPHTHTDYGGTCIQQGPNYISPVSPNLNPFANYISSEPLENDCINAENQLYTQRDYRGNQTDDI